METTEETESDLKYLKEVRTYNIQFISNSVCNGLTENLRSITSFKDFKSKMNQISSQQKCYVTYVLNQ